MTGIDYQLFAEGMTRGDVVAEFERLDAEVERLRADLVQVTAERDAQVGQTCRAINGHQAATAERDRLLAIVARLVTPADEHSGTSGWEADAEADPPEWDLMEVTEWADYVRSEPMDPVDADLIRRALDAAGDRS